MSEVRKLGELKLGEKGVICGFADDQHSLHLRLLEMGLLEGEQVVLAHQAPMGGDPIAVRVRGALIGLRRNEANLILVRGEQ